jgi:hypothetical protein
VKLSAEKATMPRMLPEMSSRYASSGSKWTKVRATPSAIMAMTAATARKTKDSETQIGSPVRPYPPKKISSLPLRSISTGKINTAPTRIASVSGANGNRSILEAPRRNPTPIPRKLPSSTKLLK